jgi:hypothetical protein
MLLDTGVLNVALIGTLVFQGLLIVALLKQLRDVQVLLETVDVPAPGALESGAAAPAFDTVGVRSGRTYTADGFGGAGGVLLFLSPSCHACSQLIDRLTQQDPLPTNLLILWRGDAGELGSRIRPPVDFATLNVDRIAAAYRIAGFPTAVSIDAGGAVVRYGHPRRYEDLEKMLASCSQWSARWSISSQPVTS